MPDGRFLGLTKRQSTANLRSRSGSFRESVHYVPTNSHLLGPRSIVDQILLERLASMCTSYRQASPAARQSGQSNAVLRNCPSYLPVGLPARIYRLFSNDCSCPKRFGWTELVPWSMSQQSKMLLKLFVHLKSLLPVLAMLIPYETKSEDWIPCIPQHFRFS